MWHPDKVALEYEIVIWRVSKYSVASKRVTSNAEGGDVHNGKIDFKIHKHKCNYHQVCSINL